MKHFCLWVAVLLLILTIKMQAALVITDADVSAGHYVYDLTYSDLGSSTVFNNDVYSQSNVQVIQEGTNGTGIHYISPQMDIGPVTLASFVYKFDFSTTLYRPTSLSIYDNLFAVHNTGDVEGTLTTSYSLDGINFTPIRSVTTDGTPNSTYLFSYGASVIDLSSAPSTVYYKMEFVADSGTFGYYWNGSQWMRLESDASVPFSADFTMESVPEPSVASLIGSALFLLAGAVWGKRRATTLG